MKLTETESKTSHQHPRAFEVNSLTLCHTGKQLPHLTLLSPAPPPRHVNPPLSDQPEDAFGLFPLLHFWVCLEEVRQLQTDQTSQSVNSTLDQGSGAAQEL